MSRLIGTISRLMPFTSHIPEVEVVILGLVALSSRLVAASEAALTGKEAKSMYYEYFICKVAAIIIYV